MLSFIVYLLIKGYEFPITNVKIDTTGDMSADYS